MKDNDNGKEEKESLNSLEVKPFFTGLLVILVSFALLFLFIGWWAILFVALIILFVLYFIWAPNQVFGCFPEEGHAVIIVEGSSFHHAYIRYEGKKLIVNNVVKGEDSKQHITFLGMYLLPLWPFRRVYKYRQRWSKLNKEGKKELREEVLWQVLLMKYVYFIEVVKVETKNKVPINLGIAIEAEIINPYKAMFIAKDWVHAMESWIEDKARDFVRTESYEDIIAKDDLAIKITYHCAGIVERMEKVYGVKITKIAVISVAPADERYAKATLDKIISEKRKEAVIVDAEAEAQKIGLETIGSVFSMLSQSTGESEKDIKNLLLTKPEEFNKVYGKILPEAISIMKMMVAIRGGAYTEIVIPEGSQGSMANLMATMVAANKISENNNKKSLREINPLPKKEFTEEELDEIFGDR
ncbi:MAG: SPFH domain-containing protein [Candidatus Paceibacterota bacterium]|jgi:regulator of protease activity HflC (stomatin/prohibitin superfamily)